MSNIYEADQYADIAARMRELQAEKVIDNILSYTATIVDDEPVITASCEYQTVEWTDEEIEEYTRNIPSHWWPLAEDAYRDFDFGYEGDKS